MRIDVRKTDEHYRADCADLPGCPPVGLGTSPEMAITCLLWRMIFEPSNSQGGSWLRFLDRKEPIILNGERWAWPPGLPLR